MNVLIYNQYLENIYSDAIRISHENGEIPTPNSDLSIDVISWINTILDKSEYFKAVINVLITSLTEKSIHPNQDIRIHQAKMLNGYSGRTLDTQVITPFLKSKKLLTMYESGWLTRSLEQDQPYGMDYRGAIRNIDVKQAFLNILDKIETQNLNASSCLLYIFQLLIDKREKNKVEINPLSNKSNFSISELIDLLSSHFQTSHTQGTARLPVLAFYSIYRCMMPELKRYERKTLKDLGSHTSADFRSGDIGDIQINDENGEPFEGVEIKYEKQINHLLVMDAFEKFKSKKVDRYYLLSTKAPEEVEISKINECIKLIRIEHGCQVIVNGLIQTLKYYLRLIDNTDQFVKIYTEEVLNDPVIKHEQKLVWKTLIEID